MQDLPNPLTQKPCWSRLLLASCPIVYPETTRRRILLRWDICIKRGKWWVSRKVAVKVTLSPCHCFRISKSSRLGRGPPEIMCLHLLQTWLIINRMSSFSNWYIIRTWEATCRLLRPYNTDKRTSPDAAPTTFAILFSVDHSAMQSISPLKP